jgi:putative phage-type endonuclease
MNKLVLLALSIFFIFLASFDGEPIHIIWLDKLIGWFVYDGWPTIYFWLALIIGLIALDNFSSFNQRRKEKKEKAEIYYQKLDSKRAEELEALAEAERKKEEAEAKRKKEEIKARLSKEKKEKDEAEAKLKLEKAIVKRKKEEAKLRASEIKRKKELAIVKAAELKRKKEEIKARLSKEKKEKEEAKRKKDEAKRKEEEASPDKSEIRIEKRADFEDLYFDQASDEWMDLVKYSIDEGDAPIIMELDSTETSDDLLFVKKRKDQKRYRSKILKQLGLKSEARFAYTSKTNAELDPMCIKHNKFPWLIAALDGVSSDFKFIVEFDSSASSYWKAKNNKISDINYAKLQHLMMVSGADTVDFWCYWPGKEGILQKVERNDTYIESLFKYELEFANNLI